MTSHPTVILEDYCRMTSHYLFPRRNNLVSTDNGPTDREPTLESNPCQLYNRSITAPFNDMINDQRPMPDNVSRPLKAKYFLVVVLHTSCNLLMVESTRYFTTINPESSRIEMNHSESKGQAESQATEWPMTGSNMPTQILSSRREWRRRVQEVLTFLAQSRFLHSPTYFINHPAVMLILQQCSSYGNNTVQ